MARADLEVGGVVGGRDLEGAGAELGLDGLVGDDGNGPVDDGKHDVLADQPGEAGVVGVHGDGGVAEIGLGARRGDRHVPRAVLEGVAHAPEMPFDLAVLDFEVGDGAQQSRRPVDEALAAIDEALVIEVDEGGADGAAGAGVHGEALAGPIEGDAECLVLLGDPVLRELDPLPDLLKETLAAEAFLGKALLGDLALDDDLGGRRGVVRSRQPEGGVALHPAPADEGVLDGRRKRVADVEDAGHVGRRQDDGERLFRGVGLGVEEAGLLPEAVEAFLDGVGVVGLGDGLRSRGHASTRRVPL